MGELSPGSTPRRWLPEGGEQKLRDKIHRESKFTDDHKSMPYSFSKPPGNKKHSWFECMECSNISSAPQNTVMVICSECGKAAKVKEYVV